VGKQTMLMLVDFGSSINFISQHMVQKLGLAVTSCPSVSVNLRWPMGSL
jgi:transcriptional regulatory protein LevR